MTENSRENLLNLSIKLFADKGYEAVGVQEICTQGNVTKPTLYYYFKSKSGILETIAQTKGTELIDRLSFAAEYKHDFSLTLKRILEDLIKFAEENREFFTLHCVLTTAPANSEAYGIYKSTIEAVQNIFLTFFRQSTAEFGNMKGKELLYSQLYMNQCFSVANMIINGTLTASDSIIHQIVHSFMYGVAA